MNEVPKLTGLENSPSSQPVKEAGLSKQSEESSGILDGDVERIAKTNEDDEVEDNPQGLSSNMDRADLLSGEIAQLLTQDIESQMESLRNKGVIQRDSGKTFIVTSFFDGTRGKSVQLHDPASNARVSLNLEDFIEKVTTPGSPWRFVE